MKNLNKRKSSQHSIWALLTTSLGVWGLGSGCGHLQLKADYSHMGEEDPGLNARIQTQYQAERDSKPISRNEVRVLVDSIPEGLSVNDGVISNQEGYNHKIFGRFSLNPNHRAFPDYEQGWRKGVCYWQVPLTWITLGIWMTVPTYYPCYTTSYNSKEMILDEVRRLVRIVGGDLAVITYHGVDRDDPTLAIGVSGFVLRLDPRLKDGNFKTQQQTLNEI